MKQEFERRLRKLEAYYAAELDSPRIISIRWLTADQISRGCVSGLVEIPADAAIAAKERPPK
jgi:hypothetical protein